MTYTLQSKCKTCFGGPRMVLQAHLKKHIIALGGWLLASQSDAHIVAPHSDPTQPIHPTNPLIAQKHVCPIYYDSHLKIPTMQ